MYTISKYTGIAHTLFLTFPPTYSLLNQTGRASSPLDHSTALTGNTKATASQGTAWVPPHRPTEGSLLLTRFPGLLGSLLPYHIPPASPLPFPLCGCPSGLPEAFGCLGQVPSSFVSLLPGPSMALFIPDTSFQGILIKYFWLFHAGSRFPYQGSKPLPCSGSGEF